MRYILLVLTSCLISLNTFSQQLDSLKLMNTLNHLQNKSNKLESNFFSLNQDFKILDAENDSLERNYEKLTQQYQELLKRIDSLSQRQQENKSALDETNRTLIQQKVNLKKQKESLRKLYENNAAAIGKLQENLYQQNQKLTRSINQTENKANTKISNLGQSLERNTLYWVIAVLLIGLLALLAFIFLKRRLSKNQSSVTEKIANTRKELESEALKLDEKLIQLLESQLKMQSEKPEKKDDEEDHSLALKVADEIVRMQKNIARMEDDTKGVKPLKKGIDRIKDNFAANGYEMPDLLGKEYDDRMKIDVINFVIDENMEKGKAIITKVVKPQVNYNGSLIQRAQVDVAHN